VGEPQSSSLPQQRRILIADDDAIFRTVTAELVSSWGYSPTCVADGEAALQVLTQSHPPTIAILDWLMPKATGPEICSRLRGGDCPQYIYFILVSGRSGREDTLEGLRSGADAYISKPLDAEELRTKLLVADRILFMEESLRDAQAETELFVNAVPSILIGTDAEGKIQRWNQAATDVFGLAKEEVQGRSLEECGIRWVQPGFHRQVEAVLKTGTACRLDDLAMRKADALRVLALNIHPLRSHLGNIVGSLIVGADITESRTREAQLRQAQKLEAIGQLAAGIAHEINTPTQFVSDNVSFFKQSWVELSSLLATVRNLHCATEPSARLAACSEICAAAARVDLEYLIREIPKALHETLDGLQRITKIVLAMKEFSHPGSGQKQLTDLNRAIQSTLTVTQNEWKYVADLVTDLDPDLPPVPCLADKFNQAILNLIINATHAIVEATGNGRLGKGRITVRTRRDTDQVEVSIADTGGGIPEDIRHRIFEPFFSTKEVGRGTGQGLALAHTAIVKEHNGSIWFQSELGKGTVFFIRLPLAGGAESPARAAGAPFQ